MLIFFYFNLKYFFLETIKGGYNFYKYISTVVECKATLSYYFE